MQLLLSSSDTQKIKRLSAVACLLLAWAAPAEQLKLASLGAGARVYRNVTVLDFNTTDVYFTHEGGMNNMKLRYLEPELQRRFHYDAEAAAKAELQQAADDALYNQSIASNMVAQAQRVAVAARRAAATSKDSLADPVSKNSLIGKPAPPIKGEKWLGERPTLEGKLVLVAFWAPWSIPCRNYVPELDRLQKKFAGKLAVVGVTFESESEIEDMIGPKMDFPSVLDPQAQFGSTVGVTSIPYVILVDPKGVVRYQGHPTAITEKQVETMLARAEE